MLFLSAIEQLSEDELRNYLALIEANRYFPAILAQARVGTNQARHVSSRGLAALSQYAKQAVRDKATTGFWDDLYQTIAESTSSALDGTASFLDVKGEEIGAGLEQKHKDASQKLEKFSLNELRQQMLDALTELSGADSKNVNNPQDLAQHVLRECAIHFKINTEFTSAELIEQRVAEEALRLQLRTVQEKLAQQGEDAEERMERILEEQLKEMGQGNREAIRNALGLETLTSQTMIQAFKTGGVTLAGLSALNATGMGAFLALTTMMKSISLLVGATIPFAAYTGATSTLSFLTGPLGIATLTLLAGSALIFKGKKHYNRAMLSGIVSGLHAKLHTQAKLTEHPGSRPN